MKRERINRDLPPLQSTQEQLDAYDRREAIRVAVWTIIILAAAEIIRLVVT